jgi:LmbE family N-acetylglucosaminyl deacetylase
LSGPVLLVHAHPDDESSFTGGLIARQLAAGARVCLVTCTGGELGEIAPEVGAVADLGALRLAELREACRRLGPIDLRLLGYRDSGMAGTLANLDPRAFINQPLAEVAEQLIAIVREVRPALLVTYDAGGTYGHPDHIRAHQVSVGALAALAAAGETVPRCLLIAPAGSPGHTVIDAGPFLERKVAALAAHRSQLGTTRTWLEQPGFLAKEAYLFAGLDLSWVTPKLAVGGQVAPEAPPLLEELGVRAVVDLRVEGRDDEDALGRHGIRFLHLPTEDARPVAGAHLDAGVAWVGAALDRGERVLIHCTYGIGRSALLACCVLVRRGLDPRQALSLVRRARVQIAPNPSQLRAFAVWSARAKKESA